MTCPECGSDTKVVDSRRSEDTVTRRRECLACGHRFTTMEVDLDVYYRCQPLDHNSLSEALLYGFSALLDGYAEMIRRLYDALKCDRAPMYARIIKYKANYWRTDNDDKIRANESAAEGGRQTTGNPINRQ